MIKIREDENRSAVENGVIGDTANRSAKAFDATRQMGKDIQRVSKQWQNCSKEQVAGRVAEKFHEGTFNKNAALKGRFDLKAVATESNGNAHSPADIEILKNGKVVDRVQVKYHKTTPRTTSNISDPKYNGMQKVVPSDQAKSVKDLANRRGQSGIGQKNYPDTAKNTTDSIKCENSRSDPLPRETSADIVEDPSAVTKRLTTLEVGNAAKYGGLIGGGICGVMSVAKNINAVSKGEKDGGEAAVAVVKDTALGGADGAVKGVATVGAEAALIRAGAQTLARTTAPVAIGITGVEVIKDVGSAIVGDIDGGELAKRTGKNVVKGGTMWGGIEAGTAIGTSICPGVGTIIGGIIGGIGGSLLGTSFFS